jgi:eukaryotic-like serine/threonine-protein kinase
VSGTAPGPEPMDQERVAALYEQARATSPEARGAFLRQACGGNRQLEAELDSLLGAGDQAEAFFTSLRQAVRSPAAGFCVGHYRILGVLGSGGMGTVYRAHDTRLDREVALKFLPAHLNNDPDARERLLVEARAAAGLEHPNVCTVHEIGEAPDGRPFIAMACYPGETLKDRLARGALPAPEAARVATEVACALKAAHDHGIIHRDVKPGNIMLCADGPTRLLDFGLAKLQDVTLTGPRTTPGTIAYMSPEQARGDSLDQRTDLWSLGVVLYEMLAGRSPFRGDSDRIVIHAILHQEPEPLAGQPGIPEGLARVARRLLRKNPSDRYRTVDEVLADLDSSPAVAIGANRSWRPVRTLIAGLSATVLLSALSGALWWAVKRGVRTPTIERLAVLPLANLTGDPGREYVVEGMHEALISELSQVPGLVVISRQSMLRYRGSTEPVSLIARELGVHALLEGSVSLAGDSVRIAVRLIRAEPEEHLWAASYGEGLENALTLQREVARDLARTIQIPAMPGPVPRATAVSREAQDAYLKGLYHHERLIQEAGLSPDQREIMRTATAWLEKAVALAPGWAPAHAKLARAYHWIASFDSQMADEYYPKSKAAALRALELDEKQAQAHASLGFVLFQYERDWAGAERAIQRALELDPNSHQWIYAIYLQAAGRTAEAVEHFKLAQERNPLSAIVTQQLAGAYACDGRPEEAIKELNELRARFDEAPGSLRSALAALYIERSMYPQAIAQLESLAVTADSDPQALADLAHGYARIGRWNDACRLLSRIETRPDRWYAPELYLVLGDTGRAIAVVESVFKSTPSELINFRCSAIYHDLGAEPRIQGIVRRLRFPH